MGRKPVLTVAGSLLTSMALAGCQTSAPSRPISETRPATYSQNNQNKLPTSSTSTVPGSAVATTTNGLPNSQLGQSPLPTSPSSSFGQSTLTSQPTSQVSAPNPVRPASTATPTVSIPPLPTPAYVQQPLSSSNVGITPVGAPNPSPLPNLTPTSGPVLGPLPPVGAMAQPTPIGNTTSVNTAYPTPPPIATSSGFATGGPQLQN
jgi:hypothetical protein